MNIQTPSRQRGVMLLEALVGILIFSIGILAMLGMQAIGMRNTIETKYRSEASYLANQIVGTMWVDRAALANYTDGGAGTTDRTEWVAKVQATLPQAATYPPSIVVNGAAVTVTVRWLRPGEAAGASDVNVSRHVVIAQINGST
jgi:type IV pilus assembly protein PilV